jgi:hypothetical protein
MFHHFAPYDVATGALRPGFARLSCHQDDLADSLRANESAIAVAEDTVLTGMKVVDGELVPEGGE